MPRSSIVLTPDPLDAHAVAGAAASVHRRAGGDGAEFELRALDAGAVLQVLVDGVVVLSVLRPRLLPAPGELTRILPGITPPAGARWWAEAYTPWAPEGALGVAVLDEAARAGLAVHLRDRSPVHNAEGRRDDLRHSGSGDEERRGR